MAGYDMINNSHTPHSVKNIISGNNKIPNSKYREILVDANFIKSNLKIYIED